MKNCNDLFYLKAEIYLNIWGGISAPPKHSWNVLPRVANVRMQGMIKSYRKHGLDGFSNLVMQLQLATNVISKTSKARTNILICYLLFLSNLYLFTECKLRCSMHQFKTMGKRIAPISMLIKYTWYTSDWQAITFEDVH